MRCLTRIAFPVFVAVATLTVCSLGVRTELMFAKSSIADHRQQVQLARQTAEKKKANHDD